LTTKRIDLSRHLFIVSALSIFVLSSLAITSFNMPSPDYSRVPDLTIFCYKIWSLIMVFDIFFIGILGGYHLANKLKVLDLEKERKKTQ